MKSKQAKWWEKEEVMQQLMEQWSVNEVEEDAFVKWIHDAGRKRYAKLRNLIIKVEERAFNDGFEKGFGGRVAINLKRSKLHGRHCEKVIIDEGDKLTTRDHE